MKIIRKSLANKTVFLSSLILLTLGGIFFFREKIGNGIQEISLTEFVVILLVMLAVLLGFFAKHVLLPLRKVMNEVEALLAGENYDKIQLGKKIDEMGTLADFFNSVVGSLEQVSQDIIDRRRLAEELTFASQVQKNLLPKKAPKLSGLDVVVKTRSASEVGGDNFDIIAQEKSTLMYIGDATGHGFPAGLIMSMINLLIDAFAKNSDNPVEILNAANKVLTPKISDRMFMTLVMLRWEYASQRLFFTGCGHEHILIYRAESRNCEAFKSGGIALGMVPDVSKILQEKELKLQPNDTVVLFTDGITEAKNSKGEMYGLDRLRSAVEKFGGQGSAENIFSSISKDFADFVGSGYEQADDITLLVAKYNLKDVKKKTLELNVDTTGLQYEKANWQW